MLDNTITLPVDAANDANVVNEVYTRFEEQTNRSTYVGDDHSLSARNMMVLTRSFPTVSGNFRGVGKTALKFTQDIEVAGVDTTTTNVSPLIGGVNFSIPVGATAAEVMHLRQRIVAMVDHAIMIRFNEKLEV